MEDKAEKKEKDKKKPKVKDFAANKPVKERIYQQWQTPQKGNGNSVAEHSK